MKGNRKIIILTGATNSGKTTTSLQIAKQLFDVKIFHYDSEFKKNLKQKKIRHIFLEVNQRILFDLQKTENEIIIYEGCQLILISLLEEIYISCSSFMKIYLVLFDMPFNVLIYRAIQRATSRRLLFEKIASLVITYILLKWNKKLIYQWANDKKIDVITIQNAVQFSVSDFVTSNFLS